MVRPANEYPPGGVEVLFVSRAGPASVGSRRVDVVEGAAVIEVGSLGLGPSAEVRDGHERAGFAKAARILRRRRGIAWPEVVTANDVLTFALNTGTSR